MTLAQSFIGIDISQDVLDVFDDATAKHSRIANDDDTVANFATAIAGRSVTVVFEATGSYDRRLASALDAKNFAYVRVNPARARDFARAAGRLAKTDAIDPRVLAAMGRAIDLKPTEARDTAIERLAALHRRRDQLVEQRADEKKRALQTREALARDSIESHIRWLKTEIARLDHAIAECVAASPHIKDAKTLFETAPGVGPITAITLIAQMPELGRLPAKAIAALAGLAPFNNDSSVMRGRRDHQGRTSSRAARPLHGRHLRNPHLRTLPSPLRRYPQTLRQTQNRHHRNRQKAHRNSQRNGESKTALSSGLNTQLPGVRIRSAEDDGEHEFDFFAPRWHALPMIIATWNINGVKARIESALAYLREASPDVICLQEIKSVDEGFPADAFQDLGYTVATHGQKGFNGVALLSKHGLEDVTRGLPGDDTDLQSRWIEALVPFNGGMIRVASIYLPNGNPIGTEKFSYKLAWMRRLEAHARTRLAEETPLVLAGDFNVIPDPIDAKRPQAWVNDALFQPESRQAYRALTYLGFTDAVRACHPGPGVYTFWDYQAGAFQKDDGIRIDHILLSPEAADRLASSGVDRAVRAQEKPSDHVPVWAELN